MYVEPKREWVAESLLKSMCEIGDLLPTQLRALILAKSPQDCRLFMLLAYFFYFILDIVSSILKNFSKSKISHRLLSNSTHSSHVPFCDRFASNQVYKLENKVVLDLFFLYFLYISANTDSCSSVCRRTPLPLSPLVPTTRNLVYALDMYDQLGKSPASGLPCKSSFTKSSWRTFKDAWSRCVASLPKSMPVSKQQSQNQVQTPQSILKTLPKAA